MTVEPLLVRRGSADDLDAVLALLLAAGIDDRLDTARSRAALQQIEAMGGELLVAERGGGIVGTLTLFILPLVAHSAAPAALVEDVAVHPNMQGQGVGRALMDAAMQRAREAGCYKLALSSNQKREGAHAFYESLGYQRHGVSFGMSVQATSATLSSAEDDRRKGRP